ncbi:OprO/OprP family phosphate-selective porin [Kangiella sediminilitoris]|uniref:Phosphate-selective porin O and P n=1 Tax=Kangiella sediminilitoris TaxID=1144748 RepID=A0A1B3B8Y0_9GAMM|nr:porin [Kangiella sediminilitoris]AOE49206.1 Phosphate-selective porin O and P [Kangiella sediminilitoris]
MKLKLLAVAIAAVISTPAFAETEAKSKAGGGMSIKTDEVNIKVGGRLMYDIDMWDGDAFSDTDTSGSDSELRRARIYVSGEFGEWEAKVQGDFDDEGDTGLSDAFIQYNGWDNLELVLGKHKEPFGLEENTSSKDITAIERTMVTNALAPGKNYGASLGSYNNDYTWMVGLYDQGEEGNNIATGVTGRMTFAPVNTDNQTFHLGFGFRQSRLAGNEYGADQRVEIHTADYKVGGDINGESISAYNLEFAYAAGPFHAQAEYFDAEVDGGNFADTDIEGYYAQFGYVLTGEARPYSKGKFKRVSPKGKDGAWEVFGRFSNYEPGTEEAEAFTLGLNYYASKAVRVGLNYVNGDITEAAGNTRDGDAIAVRFQYVF